MKADLDGFMALADAAEILERCYPGPFAAKNRHTQQLWDMAEEAWDRAMMTADCEDKPPQLVAGAEPSLAGAGAATR